MIAAPLACDSESMKSDRHGDRGEDTIASKENIGRTRAPTTSGIWIDMSEVDTH